VANAPVANAVNTVARLEQRIACNQFGSRSFREFVFDVLDPQDTDSVLEIGPGLGAQFLLVAARVRRAIGIDVSGEMVAELRRRVGRSNAVVVPGDMDDLARLDLNGPFTLAYAVYSLYYSRDPATVVKAVAGMLEVPHARCVSVNSDAGNNQEWFADLGTLYELPPDVLDVAHVCRRTILPAFHNAFRFVTCRTFEDRVRFPSVDALLAYYDACTPYCRADKRGEAARYFRAKFARDGCYEITKRSLALVGTS
jgi:hypothetical protein